MPHLADCAESGMVDVGIAWQATGVDDLPGYVGFQTNP